MKSAEKIVLLPELKRPPQPRYLKQVKPTPIVSVASTGLYVLKSASGNAKLGKGLITKGPFRGMPLFALTLPERATCWSGCQNWNRCYGDNMPFGTRYAPTPELPDTITKDVKFLSGKFPEGFVVRLHILGDFYSVPYVEHWNRLVLNYPALHIFGYTHWPQDTEIGQAVQQLVLDYPGRVSILRSDADGNPEDVLARAMTVERGAEAAPGTVMCPEMVGKTESCVTCGLCMNSRTSVSFIDHS